MNFYIVIPAHNEANFIGKALQSLINQSLRPTKIVVVDDNSTDGTASIVTDLSKQCPWISLVSNNSSEAHLPGGKIINAFYKGYESLDSEYDVICKFDADVIFPENYLETLAKHYQNNPRLGMVAGHCYIETKWKLGVGKFNLQRSHSRGTESLQKRLFFRNWGTQKIDGMGYY